MRIPILIFAFLVIFADLTKAQDLCPDPAAAQDAWKQALLQVDLYRNTYVLIYPDRLSDKFTAFGPPADANLRLGVHAGSAMEVNRAHRISAAATEYPLLERPDQIVQDLFDEKIHGAVVWAPLAGWMIQKWDTSLQLSMYPSPQPAPPPHEFTTTDSQPPNPEAIAACSQAIQTLLESYGVVPTESFKLDIFEVMMWKSADDGVQQVSKGEQLFQRYCASCHGQNAVMSKTLAPVNLLRSVRKFTYGGFAYITLKGRNMKGMPGYHGILEQPQLQQLFEYVRARSTGRLAQK